MLTPGFASNNFRKDVFMVDSRVYTAEMSILQQEGEIVCHIKHEGVIIMTLYYASKEHAMEAATITDYASYAAFCTAHDSKPVEEEKGLKLLMTNGVTIPQLIELFNPHLTDAYWAALEEVKANIN